MERAVNSQRTTLVIEESTSSTASDLEISGEPTAGEPDEDAVGEATAEPEDVNPAADPSVVGMETLTATERLEVEASAGAK